jgi:4-diphosphocytidyl-2-C-methyl-D-erythritol kinase
MPELKTQDSATKFWCAPTKLNLFLHLTGRINQPPYVGYHELQTYFQLIDYGDQLQFSLLNEPRVEICWQPGDENIEQRPEKPEDDILHRAATLLKAHPAARNKTLPGIRITLHKNAPVGGGIGGGSSAAATTLLALNHYWKLDLDIAALTDIGLRLGADVPVFLGGHSAWAEGIGEQLTPWPSPAAGRWFVIVVPHATSWTQQLFAHPDLPRVTPRHPPESLLPQWQTFGFNAFEQILLTSSPEIRASHEALKCEAGFARVTGSGACLFAPVENQVEGLRIARKIREKTSKIKRVIVAPALDHSVISPAEHKNI